MNWEMHILEPMFYGVILTCHVHKIYLISPAQCTCEMPCTIQNFKLFTESVETTLIAVFLGYHDKGCSVIPFINLYLQGNLNNMALKNPSGPTLSIQC